MTEDSVPQHDGWQAQPEGIPLSLGLVHIDRKGSTAEWAELPPDEIERRTERYYKGVEYVARAADAAKPLNWQGDGVMLFIPEGDAPAPLRAFRAAKDLWQRVRVDMNLPVRIAVHWGIVPWCADTGKIRAQAIDLCGHLQAAAPVNGIAVSEDVFLALPEAERRELGPLGVTARDGMPAHVYPASTAAHRDESAFTPSPDLSLWEAIRAYVRGSEVSKLRYVGFPLARKEPPALDILDVFVPLDVERRGGASVSERLVADRPEAEQEARATRSAPFIKAFAQRRGLIVLGEPGSGKTTLLRWLAVVAAGGRYTLWRQTGLGERLLPLPVSVGRLAEIRRSLGGTASVPDALAATFHDRSVGERKELLAFLRARLEAGECLVLLDGLDEVKASDRQAIRGWLESFAAAFPRNRFVASSRRVGYPGFLLPDAEEVALQPFEDEQVRRYVQAFSRAYRRWETREDDAAAADRQAESLLDALEANPRLRALARNPFLLSGMALIHRAERRLPRHRVQFLEAAARCLCDAWGQARRLVMAAEAPDIPYEEEALPILGGLALEMHKHYPAGHAPRAFVVDTLTAILGEQKGIGGQEARRAAAEFLRRAGEDVQVFLERGPDEWGFLHLTFQEFFAAAGLHAQERFEAFALEHCFDPRWEEVVRLGVGYMAIIQKRPKAARRFIERVREARCEALPWVTDELRLQVPLAVLLAAEAGDALPPALQQQVAEDFVAWSFQFPGEFAARVRSETSLTELKGRLAALYAPGLSAGEEAACVRAAFALGDLRARPQVEPLLNALRDENKHVRGAAADALVAILEGISSAEE